MLFILLNIQKRTYYNDSDGFRSYCHVKVWGRRSRAKNNIAARIGPWAKARRRAVFAKQIGTGPKKEG